MIEKVYAPEGVVAVIGLGLIGGSVARALSASAIPVRGFATSVEDRAGAQAAGIDVASSVYEAVCGSDGRSPAAVVLIAVPINAVGAVARSVREVSAGVDAHVLHAGGLQQPRALGLTDESESVLGTHPLAGSHEVGFRAARRELFAGARVSAESRATTEQRSALEGLWRSAGAAAVDYRTAEEHDRLMAWVSHLPQLAATALASALAEQEIDSRALGPGARDTTRLAASPYELWEGLLDEAPPDTLAALATLEQRIASIRAALDAGDSTALRVQWDRAARWRRDLPRPT